MYYSLGNLNQLTVKDVVGGCQGIPIQLLRRSEWISAHCYAVARVFLLVTRWLHNQQTVFKTFYFGWNSDLKCSKNAKRSSCLNDVAMFL